MAKNLIKGLTVEIGGDTTKLGKALEGVNSKSRDLSSELGRINKMLKLDPGNVTLLAQKQEVLSEAVETTTKKLETLKEAEKQVQAQFKRGEISAEQYRDFQREIAATEKKLDSYQKAAKQAAKGEKEVADNADKAGKSGESMGKKLGNAAKVGLQAVAAAATAAVGALVGAAESTRDYRVAMGKLDTAFTTNGHTSQAATAAYRELNGVLGDSDQAVETANHLAKLTDNEKDLAVWTGDILPGVFATFGDSLPIEGLTEAANETAKVGQVTGPLADALNWAGVSEDAFNESLAKCTTEQERQALITETLTGLYSEASEAYKETNAEVIRANEANEAWNATMAEIGKTVEPILTDIKLMGAALVSDLLPGIQQVTGAFRGLLNGDEGAAGDLGEALSGIITDLLDKVTELAPTLVEVGVALITTLVTTLISKIPELVVVAGELIVALINGIGEAFPQLVQAILDLIPQLIEVLPEIIMSIVTALLENLPILIEGIIQLVFGIVEALPQILEALLPLIPQIITATLESLAENLPVIIEAVLQLVWMLITEVLPQIIVMLAESLEDITRALIEGLATVFTAIFEWLQSVDDKFNEWISGVWASFTEWLGNIWNDIVEWLAGIWDSVSQWASDLIEGGKTAASDFLTGIIEWVKQLPGEVWTWLTGVIDNVKTWASDLLRRGKTAASDMVNGVINKIKSLPGDVWNNIVGAVDKVKQWGTDMLAKAKEGMRDVVNGVIEKLSELPRKVLDVGKNLVTGLWNGINDKLQWLKDKISGFTSSVLGSIKKFFGVKSPSKETAWIGEMLDEGLSSGLLDNMDSPVKAMQKVTRGVLGAADGIDGLALDRQLQTATGAPAGAAGDNGLLAKLDKILDAIERGQVLTIDSDSLVGATADKYDRRFGQMRALAARGAL